MSGLRLSDLNKKNTYLLTYFSEQIDHSSLINTNEDDKYINNWKTAMFNQITSW